MKRDVWEIPLLGEMSQSDKRVAVFAEKPSPTEMFVCYYNVDIIGYV